MNIKACLVSQYDNLEKWAVKKFDLFTHQMEKLIFLKVWAISDCDHD